MKQPRVDAAAFAKRHTDVHALLAQFLDTTEAYLSRFPFVTSMSQRTGMRPVWFVGALAIIVVSVLTNLIRFITTTVGVFYPAWRSFKSIETNNREDDKLWLTYWVVYAFLSFFEMFADLALTWISGYHVMKLVLLLWMFLPQYKGAQIVYNYVARPVLVRYESTVDGYLTSLADNGKQLLADIVEGEKKGK